MSALFERTARAPADLTIAKEGAGRLYFRTATRYAPSNLNLAPADYSYYARATTPGLFVVPPAKAEEMYAPETFGRGQTDRVRVE